MVAREQQRQIGPYYVDEVLGHGGMATVYRAKQPHLDRTVAIKVLQPGFAEDENFRRRFQREARLAGSLRHPNIVVVHGVGESEGLPYLVMEYLPGPTLHDLILERRNSGRFYTPEEALALLRPLAAALDYAHDRGIIHRDLKPENIIVTDQGPVITDFGLAQLLEEEGATVSAVIGTPVYMAPEQIAPAPVDRRTDVYSLGILLCELLTGQVPFTGTMAAVTNAHLYQEPPRLAELNPRMQAWPQLEPIVRRALAKFAWERWPTAGEMVAALADALDPAAERVTTAVPVQTGTKLPRRLQPPPAADAGLGRLVLLVPLLALFVGGLWAASRWSATGDGATTTEAAPRMTDAALAQSGDEPPPDSTAAPRDTVVAGAAGDGSTTAALEAAAPQPTDAPPTTAPASPTEPPASPTATEPPPTPDPAVRGRVSADAGAYLRSGPGADYLIIGGLPNDAEVEAIGRRGDWIEIQAATGERGWIASDLVAIGSGDLASLPAPDVAPPPPPAPTAAPTAAPQPRPAAPEPAQQPVAPAPQPAAPAPQPAAPTQQPAAPAPEPAVPAQASGQPVLLEDRAFSGGFRNSGASVYGGRTAVWVYGQGSGRSSMSASFQAPAGLAGPVTVVIEGMDSEDDVKTPMRVSVNGTGLWEGAAPFPNDDIPLETGRWSALTLQFDASLLQPGANTLTITNLAPGGVGRPPFVAVDYVVVQLP